MTYDATIHVPDFMRFERDELHYLLQVLRDPLAVHLYMLLLVQMRFTTGEFLSTYDRLIVLMTPPRPERGRPRKGPTRSQVRRALEDLVYLKLVRRGLTNEPQGQLRLYLEPRGKKPQKAENS